MSPDVPQLSVVICSYNGADKLPRVLEALDGQTVRDRIEVIVVDDGSTPLVDADLAAAHGARLVRHVVNRGLATARNTGATASRAPIVAYTDDDCRPVAAWAESLLEAYDDPEVVFAGGPVEAMAAPGILGRYYNHNQPIQALEAALGRSGSIPYRFWLYCKSNLAPSSPSGDRDVYTLPGANLSIRRSVLDELGGFDSAIHFGGEDEDLCYRLRASFPDARIRLKAAAVVDHDFDDRLRDALRRALAYGKGNSRNFLKHEQWGPTLYPAPIIWMLLLFASIRMGRRRWTTAALPLAFFPRWVIDAWRAGSAEPLTYAYIQVLQEGATDVGFASGWWTFRRHPSFERVPQ
jgi:glycosyltransferase involved in cell wall biosynthesis